MTKKKNETKKTNDYNLTESLDTLQTSEMLKKGFIYYINENNITINSDKKLETEFNKFKEMSAGV